MCMCSIQPLDTAVEMICNVVYGTVIFLCLWRRHLPSAFCQNSSSSWSTVSETQWSESWPGLHCAYRPWTPFIQLSALIYKAVCALLSWHCSTFSFFSQPDCCPSSIPSLPARLGLGSEQIKRTRGTTPGSGCTQRPTSALCVGWETQWGDHISQLICDHQQEQRL